MIVSTVTHRRLSSRALAELLGDWQGGGATYAALADRIRLLIIDGRMPAGTRLPSERDLAAHLGRSRATVVAAYQGLRDSGHLNSIRGSGSITQLPMRQHQPTPALEIDFARAVPPPIDGLAELITDVMATAVRALDAPGFDLLGNFDLRTAIANRFTERGLPTSPDQILVTMGAQHAIALVSRALLRRGDHALIESPTYPHAYEALRDAGSRLAITPVTREGWDTDHLIDSLDRVRPALAYLIPDFHNPTGASMPPQTRLQVIAAARRAGTTLLIDETPADLNIDRTWDDGPFARHGGTDCRIITVGSLSKSVWGGLRLGWVRANKTIIEQLIRSRPSTDLGTPQLEQLLGHRVVQELPRLLPARIAQLRTRRDTLVHELCRQLPDWETASVAGGLSVWAGLTSPQSSALALMCQTRGIALSAGPRFTVDGSLERFVRLPFTAEPDMLRAGVSALADCWNALPDLVDPARRVRWPSII